MTSGLQSNYRFSFWLPVFAALLILIPLFIGLKLILLAKLCGITVLVLLLIALRRWFALARQNNNRLERVVLTTNDIFTLKQLLPAFSQFSNTEQRILKDQLGLFLAEAQFKGEWSTKSKFAVGILAVLSTWQQGYTSKQGWVFVAAQSGAYYMEPNPSKSFDLVQDAFQAKDLSGLFALDILIEFKKEVQALYLKSA